MTSVRAQWLRSYAPILAALAAVLALAQPGPGSSNDGSRMALIESLHARRVPWTEGSIYFNRLDMAYHKGHFYSDKSPALTLYSAAAAAPVIRVFGFDSDAGKAAVYRWIVWTSSGLGLILLLVHTHGVLSLMGIGEPGRRRAVALALFCTALLPFAVTYCIYILESALIVGALGQMLRARLRSDTRAPYLAALYLGLALWTDLMIGSIFLGLTGAYLLAVGWAPAARYAVVAGLMVSAVFGINKALYGEYRPFYTLPESYIYPGSYWLTYPVIPGLTLERLKARADELAMPPQYRVIVFSAFRKQQERVKDLPSWAAENWRARDALTFGPVLLAAVWAALASALRGPWRREAAWALAALIAAYCGYLLIGVYVGECFGNRYLIPVLTPLVIFLGTRTIDPDRAAVLGVLGCVALSASLPALTRPWYVPPEPFRDFNAALNGLCLLLVAAVELRASARRSAADLARLAVRLRWPALLLGSVLAVFQWQLYHGRIGA
ncbi:MAG: hypothetical protein MOGMAGMI_00418 [Candidatus Omnitrophica bacterium]|nr:hypothetical protein [Candidatus Omnitrophota bacterium]